MVQQRVQVLIKYVVCMWATPLLNNNMALLFTLLTRLGRGAALWDFSLVVCRWVCVKCAVLPQLRIFQRGNWEKSFLSSSHSLEITGPPHSKNLSKQMDSTVSLFFPPSFEILPLDKVPPCPASFMNHPQFFLPCSSLLILTPTKCIVCLLISARLSSGWFYFPVFGVNFISLPECKLQETKQSSSLL